MSAESPHGPRALHPLAVLPRQVPLLRLQFACQGHCRWRNLARILACRPAARGGAGGRRKARKHLLRRRHPFADAAFDRRGAVERGRTAVGLCRRDRDHPRGQSVLGRSEQIQGFGHFRGQPRLARTAIARRFRAEVSRPATRCSRGPNGTSHRAYRVPKGVFRPDLRPARSNCRSMADRTGAGTRFRHLSSVALPAHHRARHAFRDDGAARRFHAARR